MYRFPSLKHSNWLFFHEQYDGVTGKMFWWLTKKIIFWLWAGWGASYLQRSLSAQVNGGSRCHPNLWKQLFSAVRASGGYPGNGCTRQRIHNTLIVVDRYLRLMGDKTIPNSAEPRLESFYPPFVAGIDLPNQGVADSYNLYCKSIHLIVCTPGLRRDCRCVTTA